MRFDVVGEEKQLEDKEDDDELDEDDEPERLAQRHVAETVIIEVEYPVYEPVFLHWM